MGDTVQFICSIDLSTDPPDNNLHLNRMSVDGSTCGVCDQLLKPAPPNGGLGQCTRDTDADYSIQCEWNPSSTVMTFTVTGLTAMEITDWICTSRGLLGTPLSLTLEEFGEF